jgi:branched-chain amino acid transport system permease protein
MDYFLHIGTLMALYMVLVQSMNIYLGYTNILALSHIAFMGIGAYSGALITMNGGSYWLGFLVAGLIAIVLGFLIGLTSIKLKADYLGIATLGFAYIINVVTQNWTELTRGPLGLPGIPRPSIFGYTLTSKLSFFLFTLLICSILMFLMYRIVKSPFGKVLETIRDDEVAAKSLGTNTIHYKLLVFSLGSMIAALVGTLYSPFIGYIDPKSFTLHEMALILVMMILGGLGTFRGAFLGVLIIVFIQEGVTFLSLPAQYVGALQLLLYSLVFLTVMIYFPQGVGGFLKHKKRRKKQFTNY